jgi:hypothetical protein
MKTIFYKKSDDDKGDYWFNDSPYKEWFVLENVLYEPNGSIRKYTVDENNIVKDIAIAETEDKFSSDGIVRRIALYVAS